MIKTVNMDLSKAVQIINMELPSLSCDNFKIISDIAAAFEQIEQEKLGRKQELFQSIDAINGLKIDNAYNFDKEFQEQHPILGNLKDNIFFEKPLFESIQVGMKEPQYTTALGWFLQKDQKACRLFIESLREVVKFPTSFIFPTEKSQIESIWEYSGKNLQNENEDETNSEKNISESNQRKEETSSSVSAGNDVKNRKEIDNLLTWEIDGKKFGVILEIKFGADLHNELPCYQLTALKEMGKKPCQKKDKKSCVFPTDKELNCKDCLENNPLICIVLSSNRISAQEIEKNNGCRKIWHRVLWRHFLPKLNEKMAQYQENGDYKRFLSSLWRKVFETER